MRALVVEAAGADPVVLDLPIPEPGQGQVRIRVSACGLNFADLLLMKGQYQDKRPFPLIPGLECAGQIDALGPDVTDFEIGQRVACYTGAGGLAEAAIADAQVCVPIPATMDDVTAAAFQIAYGTSHMALTYKARLSPGETLVVLGAAGGVGLTAVEIGKRLGARVIAVARSPAKLAIAQAAGADHLIDSETADLRAELKALGGVDVVYDAVGGEAFRAALSATKPDGRILIIGFASGDMPEIKPNHLLVKNVTVIGFWWGGYVTANPAPLAASLTELFAWHAEGGLSPHISQRLPLERATEGFELLRSRRATGKIVVEL